MSIPKMAITPEGQLRGKVIPPGIYVTEITEVEAKSAKTDGSQNWNVKFKILEGDFAGVTLYKTFNEKGEGFMESFIEACGGKLNPKETYFLDWEKVLKTKLRVVVKNGLKPNSNDMQNVVDGYLPLT